MVCESMKIIRKKMKIAILLKFQIPAFRGFCTTDLDDCPAGPEAPPAGVKEAVLADNDGQDRHAAVQRNVEGALLEGQHAKALCAVPGALWKDDQLGAGLLGDPASRVHVSVARLALPAEGITYIIFIIYKHRAV